MKFSYVYLKSILEKNGATKTVKKNTKTSMKYQGTYYQNLNCVGLKVSINESSNVKERFQSIYGS